MQILGLQNRNAVGLVQFTGHFRQQFIGCDTYRASQPGGIGDGLLYQASQRASALALPARHVGEVNVNLIHAPVFHHGRKFTHDVFEAARVIAVLVEIHRQQNRVRAQLCRFHHTHGRAHTKCTRRIRGRGDHTASGVAADERKHVYRNLGQVFVRPFTLRLCDAHACQQIILAASAAADDHRQPFELWITQ